MSFYQQIAPYYHHIFKINAVQVDFVKSKIPQNNVKLVDIGCGIGTLSFELINYYNNILGVDLDAEMIQSALKNNVETTNFLHFEKLSMLELTSSITENSIDGIICFGNTLVHLNSLNEIEKFLMQAKSVLKPNGKLLLQIVNYNRILSKNVKQLPLINNDEILFERNYNYKKAENKIDFNTKLTVKSTQQLIKNSIELLPILKEELAFLMNKVGFNNCNFYGSFKQETYSVESPALVVEAC
ncbi:Methyltransferase domain-containing protein [Lutibacter oricola]|uniref:Methyltransferase domain-containing protein n=1 Tax=Lutibacter oricola TaxID=762486 RepID=A0A1H2XFC8_9FLAO|nr:Methyltransferase domain-containing protein [Lutibacter oricola]